MEAISLLAVAVGIETFSKDAKEVLDALLAIQGKSMTVLEKFSDLSSSWTT